MDRVSEDRPENEEVPAKNDETPFRLEDMLTAVPGLGVPEDRNIPLDIVFDPIARADEITNPGELGVSK